MALTFTSRGSGARNTGSEAFYTITPGSNSAAGSMMALCLSYDNSGTNGADPFVGAIDTAGNYWISPSGPVGLNDPGAASAGQAVRILYCLATTAFTTSHTVTVYFNATTVARSYTLYEITAAAGSEVTYVSGAAASQTSATPSITTASLTSGDGVIGVVGREGNGTRTADGDATNGTWSNSQNNGVGSTTSGSEIISETKVVTGTATQTYNPTFAAVSRDGVNAWAQFREAAITYPRTLTFASPMVLNNGFGGVLSDNAVYATALSGGTLSTNSAVTAFGVGQQLSGTYTIREGFLWFDTTIIPTGARVSAATLSISGGGVSISSFTMKVSSLDYGASVDTSDYKNGASLPLTSIVGTATNVTTWPTPGYNAFDNVAMENSIIAGGLTKYFLWGSASEGSGTAPTGGDFVWMSGTTNGTNPPKLVVTYTLDDPSTHKPYVNMYTHVLPQ